MDTAQRGMGLDWPTSLELIRRASLEGARHPGRASSPAAPAPTTSPARPTTTLDDVIAAYEEQCDAIESRGGRIILMASRALAACARSPDDYARVYDRVLSQVRAPGDPALAGRDVRPGARRLLGRRGGLASDPDHARATDVCVDVIARQRGEGRRHQGVAARRGQGDRDAPRGCRAACACTPATISTSPS